MCTCKLYVVITLYYYLSSCSRKFTRQASAVAIAWSVLHQGCSCRGARMCTSALRVYRDLFGKYLNKRALENGDCYI